MTTLTAAAFQPQAWILTALVAAAAFIVLTGVQRRRRCHASSSTPAVDEPIRNAGQGPHAAERWQVDLHEFTREAEARLDTKLAALQRLIAAADERIEHLESLGLEPPPAAAKPPSLGGPHFRTLEAAPQGQARTAAIYAMSDAGNNAATIATRLGTPIAEVELTLSLRRSAD